MRALFSAPRGREKHMVATDHLDSPLLRRLTHDDLFDIVARHGLHFDQGRQTGVVFHMMSALSEHGRVGVTAVGDSPGDADVIYRRAEQIIAEEAEIAVAADALPRRRRTRVRPKQLLLVRRSGASWRPAMTCERG